ncbi:E3 ubiquitin-protein ligase rnf213-alpha [Cebidichthys violaceus]|uniref:E3 ubiquitin-protein ligase rnf213-alpha n=1 Tax=Cebidichthys violaceus TaxID=271503 RepID=UPI0035CABCE4
MFCPECGNQVEKSYKFCPQCGFKLFVLTQNRTQDVASSAHQPSGSAEKENQKEDQDQVLKDVKEQENLAQIKGQPASDEQEAARDGATPQDPSDNAASPATLEKRASSPNQTLSVQIPADKPSDIHSGLSSTSVSSLASPKETSSIAPESSEQTPQDWVMVEKQSVSEQDKEKTIFSETQHLSGKPDEKGQLASDDQEAARDGATPQNPSDNAVSPAALEKRASSPNLTIRKTQVSETCKEERRPSATTPKSNSQPCSEVAPGTNLSDYMTPPSSTPASDKLTEQQTEAPPDSSTEDRFDAVKIPADKPSDLHSGLLSNSVSFLTLPKETGSTVPESSEQTPQDCDMVAKQSVSEQDKEKTIFSETQHLSGKPDEKAVDTRSKDKTNTRLAEIQKQQPDIRDVDVSTSPKHSRPLSQNISKTSTEVQAPQILPSSECIPVYFHAVTSKDFHLDPEKDEVFLMSERMFGHWNNCCLKMSFSRSLGYKSYLVEGKVMIPRNLIHESIPYKYIIFKHIENDNKGMYETIYQKDGNQYVNRCLKIKEDFLTHEGEWHQYDDMIHPELKKKFGSWNSSIEDIVLKRRDQAGRVMLNIIFDLPTTWNKPNLDNFFLLLQQFFYTYSNPVLHCGTERPWGLPYNHEQVKSLLKRFLEENINHNPRKQRGTTQSMLSPLRAGVVSLLIYNKYLKDDMTNQLSSLCDLLRLPKKPQHHFLHFWEDFASPLSDKKSVADAVEILCNKARQQQIEKWVLVIPLIHLLRGDSKPFEPVPPVSNPQFDSWSGLNKGTHFNSDNYARGVWIMKEHAYLTDIDHLLVQSWMSLVPVDYLTSFISTVKVELLDILHYMQFTIKSGITRSNYKALEELAGGLINRESHRIKSFGDKYKECCLKTAVRLLGSICRHTTDPGLSDVPIYFLDLVCLIANACDHTDSQSRDRSQESILETLETMRKWRRNTFRNKLLNEWDRTQFSVLHEIKVWDKLVSVSFSHQEHTSLWRTPFLQDFEGKLKQEHPEDQIGMYSNKMEELSKTSPLLCNTMEKCAMEAIAAICQV